MGLAATLQLDKLNGVGVGLNIMFYKPILIITNLQ